MSKLTTGIFGAIAVSLTFGAVQFASGRDLSGAVVQPISGAQTSDAQATGVNRSAKTDRAAGAGRFALQTKTISLELNGMSDTSVLVRMPLAQATRNGGLTPSLLDTGKSGRIVACEPVVSVLTEVAKQLAPGRCVT